MADCSNHGERSTGRCYTCHRPFCPRCNPQNGCCSLQCASSRERFSNLSPAIRKRSIWPLVFKILVAVGLLAFAWTKRAVIMGWIEGKL